MFDCLIGLTDETALAEAKAVFLYSEALTI